MQKLWSYNKPRVECKDPYEGKHTSQDKQTHQGICGLCDKQFAKNYAMKKHMLTNECIGAHFKCEDCKHGGQ